MFYKEYAYISMVMSSLFYEASGKYFIQLFYFFHSILIVGFLTNFFGILQTKLQYFFSPVDSWNGIG